MKTIIQLTRREEARALPIILRHSPGMILRDRVYVVDESVKAALRKAGITFTELGHESNAPALERSLPGERII